ncbi:endoribonuclease XendoU, partial [Ostertagia ostertagi]
MQTSMLLNTSPEFEMAVYTICALNGGQCEMTINNQPVGIFASTLVQNGVTVIDQCYPAISGSAPKTTKKSGGTTKKPSASDPDLQILVDNMRAADVDKAGPNDYTLDWGNKVSGNKKTSPNQLFAYVNETLFQRPVYATLIDVFNRNLFTPEVCTAEQAMTGFRKAGLQQVFDTWTATEVFNLAFQYLQKKGYSHATDMATLKTFLWNLWFGTYSRCSGALGSSGWETCVVGRMPKGTTVDGQHDWARYYLLQKAGNITYHGYFSYVVNLTGTFQYTWENELKQEGGFLIGTSP